jgi:glycosyltransferase involved in cell wall biosynthesis
VVVPTHNRVAETVRAVRSALSQTLQDIEIIVVDDGSQSPDTLKLRLQELADSRIKFIGLSPNRGANHARNVGVSLALGAFIAFLDSDDEWLPGKLQAQQALLKGNPENTVCSCRAIARSTVGTRVVSTIIPRQLIQQGDRVDDYLFCRRGALVTPSLVLSRELAVQHPFDVALRRHQDFAYLLRLASAGVRFRFVEDPLVIVHWESLSSSQRHIQPRMSAEFLTRYSALMSRQARCGFWCRNVVVPLFIAGRYREGFRALIDKPSLLISLIRMPRLAAQIVVLLLGVPPVLVQRVPQAIRRIRSGRAKVDP